MTRLIPPRGESKFITWEFWDQTMLGGGSGAKCTTHVRLMVDPILINSSGLPRISVMGSEKKLSITFCYLNLIKMNEADNY